jgi:two-component system phosphate regulon sensor histidine kinase PhoR
MPEPGMWVVGRLALLVLPAGLLGLALGQPWLLISLVLLVGLGYHLYELRRLSLWLQHPVTLRPPSAVGQWERVYANLYRLRQRGLRRKRLLVSLFSRFREAAEALPDAAIALGPQFEIQWYNAAASRLLGLRRHDSGRRLLQLLRHPRFINYVSARDFADAIEFPSPVDEAITLSVRIVSYDEEQRLLLAADVSRTLQLERMRSDFVSNVSHELRTPLTVISGYLESLLEPTALGEGQWAKPLRQMALQARRMQNIVEDLLMLARLEGGAARGRESEVCIPGMLAAIREDAVALSADRGHQISLESDPGLWLRGVERELRSAFSNIVFNAVRYTPDGGHVWLRWFEDARGVAFEVADDGEGIPPQHLPRITERFYRVDAARSRMAGGTGLGLAIVKHVLLRHDARLEIRSELGAGSVFTCRFPQWRAQRQVPKAGDAA